MLHNLRFFLFKMPFIHNATFFGSCIIHILNTGCAENLKGNSGAKGLKDQIFSPCHTLTSWRMVCLENMIVPELGKKLSKFHVT